MLSNKIVIERNKMHIFQNDCNAIFTTAKGIFKLYVMRRHVLANKGIFRAKYFIDIDNIFILCMNYNGFFLLSVVCGTQSKGNNIT